MPNLTNSNSFVLLGSRVQLPKPVENGEIHYYFSICISLDWLYSVLQVKKKEFAMKEEEEKTKKKPNWALQVSTLSDNKV